MTQPQWWAFVENGAINQVIEGMPKSWRNIHSMDRLSLRELADLSWAGHEDCRVLPVVQRFLEFDESTEYLAGPKFAIVGEQVLAEYEVMPIEQRPPAEIPVANLAAPKSRKGARHETGPAATL